ncbi:hypothetical protein ARAM_003986 [Aspergillus rambellii]|uniref:RRM domain-containing protein n=1 Tax=Aspergillus rambellii TaxID=308745 RepID=A0A0F8XC97_9EURO|nr:hypothetical protein ARAM_003986 [Aspergillus rambellii]
MTPDSPDEALHFRGKTLTPESPRPLHIAEPANIPVLQNQMDPVFNDTSTYEKSVRISEDIYHVHHNGLLSSHGPYTGSGGAGGNAGSIQGSEQQPPSQHHSHIQGSFHPGRLRVNGDGRMDPNITTPLTAIITAPFPAPSNPSPPSQTTEPYTQKATPDSSLTASPTSDPISLLAHPVPGLPPSSFSHPPHEIPFAHEVDHQAAPQSRLDPEAKPDDNSAEGDVDFQNLLDNLPPSTAPSAPTVSGTTHLSTEDPSATPQAGLPPRPPPQEKPSIHPNYNPSDDIRSYHQLPAHTTPDASNPYTTQQSSYQSNAALPPLAAAGAPGTSSGTSALPPPPIASFQQPPSAAAESQEAAPSVAQKAGRVERPPRIAKPGVPDEDAPWGPEVQKKYDEFLHDERVYVTEGLWDRFPYGSRLFVGNLPTERVTKRDLFHIFHNYGKLAQISIKQAYGFIQFLDASACKKALDSEQGAVVRGRKKFRNRKETPDLRRLLQNLQGPHHHVGQGPPNIVGVGLQAAATREPREIDTNDPTCREGRHSATLGANLLIAEGMIIGLP